MRSEQEIQEFYRSELKTSLAALEARRKAVVRSGLIAGGATLLVVGLAVLYGLEYRNMIPAVIVLILGVVVTAILVAGPAKRYKADFKHQVIRPIVKFFDPELSYSPQGKVSEGRYMQSEIFKHRPDRYKGDDLVSGTIGKTRIEFSELHTEYKTTSTDSKGRTQTSWHTIFQGLFFVADFNKDFRCTTVVLPDTAERLFGGLGKMLQSWNFTRDQLIKLEDPEFEREFAVYGSDQIEARYILSPSLMQRILQFKRSSRRKIHLSFVRSCVFVAVSYSRALFEPRFWRSIEGFGAIGEYFEDLKLAVGIVEDLNLNTRIWSKE